HGRRSCGVVGGARQPRDVCVSMTWTARDRGRGQSYRRAWQLEGLNWFARLLSASPPLLSPLARLACLPHQEAAANWGLRRIPSVQGGIARPDSRFWQSLMPRFFEALR